MTGTAERIRRSRAFVILIPAAPWPANMVSELATARAADKPIVAILRDGYAMPDGLEPDLLIHADAVAPDVAAIADQIKAWVESAP